MSFAAQNTVRAITRASLRPRFYSSTAARRTYAAEQDALQHHAAQTTDLWRKISYFVCVPGIAVCCAWVYNAEEEHKHHLDHLKAENGGHLPEVPGYEYMNRRTKPYPWGMNSLFFNPHTNKDMSQ